MSFASDMYATALELLTEFGESVSAVRASGTYDPATGITATTNTSYTGVGYPSNYRNSNIDGTIIKQGDILLVLSSATRPLINDVITVQSKAYTALNVQIVTVAGSDVVYKIQLRQ